ncbi:MAG: DUF2071 domain-containing protein [Planctomycetaceae bacterium]|nr:DUF2071 domain-containing protein [Planctomycetaceae bacterium]
MKIPTIRGVIDRRILANYHIDPDVLAKVLPAPFRPKLVKGKGIAGICLIRLKEIRPRFLPAFLGISSENAAHRVAVEWEDQGQTKEGVYIPRRDTSSRLNTLAGGRLFPGVHHHAQFRIDEQGDSFSVIMESDDDNTHVTVKGHLTSEWPKTSVFDSIQEASAFFECGSLGYSDTRTPGEYDGLELHTINWGVEALAVEEMESSFFDNESQFPKGSVEFDCALLMQNIQHAWYGRPLLCAQTAG